jgi:hypothetical protein
MRKVVEAGGELKSFAVASRVLKKVGEVAISNQHVRRLTEEIGHDLAAQRDQQVEDYLHHRRAEPTEPAPAGAVVAVDGGRIQTRVPCPGQGPGVHEHGWKEDKVACLYAVAGSEFADDPHLAPPRAFLDTGHVDELAKDLHAQRGLNPDWPKLPKAQKSLLPKRSRASTAEADTGSQSAPAWPPPRGPRTCVATIRDSEAFGKMVAAEAYARNFYSAKRRAFLADGQRYNWTIRDKWFADFEPIVDFVHVVSYLYAAATATAADLTERWTLYVMWMTLCWQGQEAIAAIQQQAQTRGLDPPDPDTAETDPRVAVPRTITYLTNNATHMDYPRYRRLGLPVTSAAVESLIKEMNYRVKGTEKFWNHPESAEAILQVRAAILCDDDPLERYLATRPGSPHRYTRGNTPTPTLAA